MRSDDFTWQSDPRRTRRRFIRDTALLTAAGPLTAFPMCAAAEPPAAEAAEQAHAEIWRRFIGPHNVMLDFTMLDGSVSLPTPEECRAGKPNALGWWAPIENGAMFCGLYLDAAVNRWRRTRSAEDAEKARRLMEGLLFLNSISDVPGFVGRGVSTDGKSHYAMGSNDQTFPWFLGLWRYLDSGLAGDDERRIVAHLSETADAIVKLNWAMPAEPPFGRRGGFLGLGFDNVPRLLFVAKMMHVLSGDAKWDAIYRAALARRGGKDQHSGLEVCERGMFFETAYHHTWTSCCSVGALRGLWELEKDETLRAAFAQGLQASADVAFQYLPLAQQFDRDDKSFFDPDWRRCMLPLWKPQQTEQEAQDLAHEQLRAFCKQSPRRSKECDFVREPASAAWIVTLAPDPVILTQRAADIRRVIAHYNYAALYYCTFFWVESAWWRLVAAAM
jgi:hypothetical protein